MQFRPLTIDATGHGVKPPPGTMISLHLRRLRARDDISADEEATIRAAVSEIREFPSGSVLIRAHETSNTCLMLLAGLVGRRKDLSDGRCQITELHLPGDFTDLHSFSLKRLDHDVVALAPSIMAVVPHQEILRITERHPHLTRVYWFATNLDAAIHREWELSLGRRNALERTAHLLCELQARLSLVGLGTKEGFRLPLTQATLGECLALSNVHVNRTLKQLRESGLADVQRGQVTIHDLAGLQALCEFDPAYLYLERRPRL